VNATTAVVAQAISGQLQAAEVWVQFQTSPCGICGGRSAWDTFYSQYFCLQFPASFHRSSLSLSLSLYIYIYRPTYRVIHKSLREFRPLQYSSRDGHAEGKHVNRGRDTPSFCPTLQVLICSFLLCLSWLVRSRVRKFRRDL
jgi:hypothetical protein